MPNKLWNHQCGEDEQITGRAVEICPACGKQGQYAGWRFSVTELMSMYQRRTGLPPIGAHRPFADKLLRRRFKSCESCNGRGILDVNHGEDWKECPECQGAQYIFDGDSEDLKLLRAGILKTRLISSHPKYRGK